jgi:hypothetical protein
MIQTYQFFHIFARFGFTAATPARLLDVRFTPKSGHWDWNHEMSALCGGLKRSTQHFISDASDGVDGRWAEDMFEGSARWPRRSCETAGGAHFQPSGSATQ